MKVVIIGGVAGGATAAARLRRLDEKAQIVIIERSGYISYANCGLPYYIGGEITRKESLTLQTPESFWRRFRIDVRVKQEAVSIDAEKKIVGIKNLVTGEEYKESYDKLILSPGAKAIKPDIEGIENEKVFTLRTVEDTFAIAGFVERNHPKTATVIGGGFIGLEMAENLVHKGIDVTVVQRSNHVMPTIDSDMAAILHNYMRNKGIKLCLNSGVIGIEEAEGQVKTLINGKEAITSDMLIMAVGVVPESSLAKEAGLELGIKGAIVTNTHMQTSNLDIYAVGDAVEVKHFVTDKKAVISLAGPANKQGRIAADNICGIQSEFKGSQGSSIMKMFGMTVASTGLSKTAADREGIDSDYVILTSSSHANYYPGAESMYVKVVFEKENGKILGAQIIGFGGVDKRIDVLATAIRAKMTAYDLEELDLAYAPPYSSAKDPVNMAGFAICNVLDGIVKQIHWDDLERLPEDAVILDTRTDGEYANGHIEGALHIPLDSLRERMNEVPEGKTLYVYCQSGLRSYLACRILGQNGYDCFNVSGGFGFYQNMALNKQMEQEGTGPCGLR
ncbi:MAG: FAD-dependent oxidoreductase [Tyzzerella sp.]|nr:FAD-dependent oxidoreductase [Tyzzerella sp.]